MLKDYLTFSGLRKGWLSGTQQTGCWELDVSRLAEPVYKDEERSESDIFKKDIHSEHDKEAAIKKQKYISYKGASNLRAVS